MPPRADGDAATRANLTLSRPCVRLYYAVQKPPTSTTFRAQFCWDFPIMHDQRAIILTLMVLNTQSMRVRSVFLVYGGGSGGTLVVFIPIRPAGEMGRRSCLTPHGRAETRVASAPSRCRHSSPGNARASWDVRRSLLSRFSLSRCSRLPRGRVDSTGVCHAASLVTHIFPKLPILTLHANIRLLRGVYFPECAF